MKEIMSECLRIQLTVVWLNLTMANQTVKNGLKAKKIKLAQFFILQNFKKILRADPELWGCVIFEPRMAYLSWTFFFKYKPLILLSSTYSPFYCAKFKKILPEDPELWGCTIFGLKMAHFSKWEFFSQNLLMNLVSFVHAYLHAKNESQILIY